MNPDDYADLLREQRIEDLSRAYAEAFVEYVLGEATDHGEFDGDQAGDALMELLNEMSAADFRPWELGEDEMQVEAFAGPGAYYAIRDEYDLPVNLDLTDVDQIEIQGVTVRLDPSLPDDCLLAVHMDAIAPALPSSRKSWLVKSPEGVRTVRIPEGRRP